MPKNETDEKAGGLEIQVPQTLEYSEVMGIAHIWHDGPVYLLIVAQHLLHKGESSIESDLLPQLGQTDGKRSDKNPVFSQTPLSSKGFHICRI